jgi:hypothetical protein
MTVRELFYAADPAVGGGLIIGRRAHAATAGGQIRRAPEDRLMPISVPKAAHRARGGQAESALRGAGGSASSNASTQRHKPAAH